MSPLGFHLRTKLRQACGLLLAFGTATSIQAQETDFSVAVDHLNQMSMAMSQMTYQGTFVYVQDSLVETMRITHVVDENGIHERLVSQNGPQREILRDSNIVHWVAKDKRAVVSDPVVNRGFLPNVTPDALEKAADYYVVSLGGLEPLAGRMGRKLSIRPRDQYRYGYTLWLEQPSGFLLRWELFENGSQPLARLMFTDIRIGQEVDQGELKTRAPIEDYQTQSSDLPEKQSITRSQPRWAPSKLPPGFHLTAHRREDKHASSVFQHLVYSDGIAAVSVYVEQRETGQGPPAGSSRHGTTNAHSRSDGELLITVVGDVPAITVEEIAWAISPTTP